MQAKCEGVKVTYDSVEDRRERVEECQERGHRQEGEGRVRKCGDEGFERRHLALGLRFIDEWVSEDCAGRRLRGGTSLAVGVSIFYMRETYPDISAPA